MNDEPKRPDPDDLLRSIEVEEKKARRGRLKIFFGSSAGVGKTYAMLSAAHEQLAQGRSVLVGVVETHKRPETEHLLEGLLILQPLEINYRGLTLKELDLDAALTRKPEILLVDELAHTNAPGCRHPKRWNDVMEILGAGIDVYTTLNVQHIESLSDLVAGATGIWVRETVPDTVFDLAEDVVLVDIDEDDLMKRLREGKVYLAPGAQTRAAENFFRKSNLSALREMALRRTAERVDAERDQTTQTVGKTLISDKILVCVGPQKISSKLVRSAKRMATALKAHWVAAFVEETKPYRRSGESVRSIEALERMVERMGGKMVTLRGEDIAEEIIGYARANQVTKILIGKDFHFSLRNFFRGLLVDRIVRMSGMIDVYVVSGDAEKKEREFKFSLLPWLKPSDYFFSFLAVFVLTFPGFVSPGILTSTDQALIYMAGSVMVAVGLGLGPSLFYALLSALAFNAFFLSRSRGFSFENHAYLVTFAVMLLTGYTVATQASRLRMQAVASREKEGRMRALYTLTRTLTAARGRFPVSEIVSQYISQTHNVDVSVWMTNAEGHPAVVLGNLPEATYYKDFGALQWCYENAQNAGRGTSTMPSAAGYYVPLATGGGTLGVIGLFPRAAERLFTNDEIASFETLASLLASALDRVRAGEIAQQVLVEKENEKVRSSLLEGEGAEIRAPVGMEALSRRVALQTSPRLDAQSLREISTLLHRDLPGLSKDLARFLKAEVPETTAAKLNRRPTSLLDRATHVTQRDPVAPMASRVDIAIASDLPDVLVDLSLIEQALADLLLYAFARSGPQDRVIVAARREGSDVFVSVADSAAPLEAPLAAKLFDAFPADAPRKKNQDEPLSDEPLSLAVPAGIIRLHGGNIWSEKSAKGTEQISFSLPIA